jgi:DUF1009 family protein
MTAARIIMQPILPDPPDAPASLGLIAAGGRLPVLVAEGMKAAGHEVHAVGFIGQYLEELPKLCDSFREASVLRLGSWTKELKAHGVRYAVMVGKIEKGPLMYDWRTVLRNRPDLRTIRLWMSIQRDRRSHRILSFTADELARDGIHLIDSTAHIGDHMATVGPMTKRRPTPAQTEDIHFAWPLLTELLRLDIGQSIAVRDGDVLAVEALEGTDRMIARAADLCRAPGWTLLKAARIGHDRRADVPTIGPQTIENLHAAGGGCIALGAGDVIIIDKPQTLELADRLGIAMLGVSPV